MSGFLETSRKAESAIIVGVFLPGTDEDVYEEQLAELTFLVETAGAKIKKRFQQRLERPDARFFIGSGKLGEIKSYLKEQPVDMVVFDDELSPSQQRNLQRELEVKIIDRTNLILDIFAARAKTSYARTQVELAQYQYILPRLSKMWQHLQKQRGGIGMKGPGEKEIETDRRIVRDRIALLRDKLRSIDKQMQTQRKNRGEFIRVALVGYTNAGKSTLMNLLTRSDVLAEDKLFATLDTTVRKSTIHNLPLLFSDTVGFIRKLPTQLVESFKSTLDEVREADLLLHVVDISNPRHNDQIEVVQQTLHDIGAADKPVIMVFNKIDKLYIPDAFVLDNPEFESLPRHEQYLSVLRQSWMSKAHAPAIFISASKKSNITELKEAIYRSGAEMHKKLYPYNNFLY